MNLLLVGASSFIGKEIYKQAKNQGMYVVGTSTKPNNGELFAFNLKSDDIRDVFKTSGLWEKMQHGESVYAIVTAFYCGNERTVTNLREAEMVNLFGMQRMLKVFHEMHIKTLWFSTEQVFSGRDGLAPYKEDEPTCPVLAYGRHKAEMECYIKENMPEMLIYRLSQNIDVDPQGIQIFTDVYHRQKTEKHFKSIQGQIISPTYVGDTAKWAIEGLKCDLSGIYHCANPESMPRAELVRRFLKAIDSDANVEEVPLSEFDFKESRPLDTRLDISKIEIAIPNIRFTSLNYVLSEFVRRLR